MIAPKYETRSRHNSTTKKSKAMSKAAYAACTKRSRGLCEGCVVNPGEQIHHRKYRSRGGLDELSNLLHLCVSCHEIAHSGHRGEVTGWAIRSGHNPERVPYFRLFDGTWWRFVEGLEPELIPAPYAVEYMHLIGAMRTGMAV